jgi:tetratricopeptide (TPR) repeat protein
MIKNKEEYLELRSLIIGFLILVAIGFPFSGFAKEVNYDSLASKAVKLGAKKKPKEVIKLLEPYRKDPENLSDVFFNNLGVAYKAVKRFRKAEWAFLRSLKIAKNKPVTNFNLALTYYELAQLEEFPQLKAKELEKASHYLTICTNLDPKNRIIKNLNKWKKFVASHLKAAKEEGRPKYRTHY